MAPTRNICWIVSLTLGLAPGIAFGEERLAVLGGLALPAGEAPAATLPSGWGDTSRPYPYIALDQPVRDVLMEFGRNLALPVIIAEDVDGTVSMDQRDMPPQLYMRELARRAGLQWYYDGVSLHIVRNEDARSRLIDLGGTTLSVVQKTVTDLGLADPRFPIREAGRTGLAIIAGPRPYVETVENVVRALGGRDVQSALAQGAEQPGGQPSGIVPRVYRGISR
ncbi:MAG: hypothetical protein AAFR17_09135 [Pseudomonadota bacterium]